MSALASDIEDERRPALPSHRPTINSYNYSSQHTPTTNSSTEQINTSWLMQQQYSNYHDQQQAIIHSNGVTSQKQQRYPTSYSKSFISKFLHLHPILPLDGSSPKSIIWNGNQQQSNRLEFANQLPQRLPPTQSLSSASSSSSLHYSQSIINNNTYPSNSTVTTNHGKIGMLSR